MPNYYVATVVEAVNESEARQLGHEAIVALVPGRIAPIEIRIVRLATPGEVDLHRVRDSP